MTDKEIYPVGTKVQVTKDHAAVMGEPWPKEGDVLTVTRHIPMPHAYNADVDIYATADSNGARVVVREDHITRYVEPLPEGALIFVKETHPSMQGWRTNYAGTRARILGRYAPHYTVEYEESGVVTSVHEDKIALVEFEQLTPPVAPSGVAEHVTKVWCDRGTDLEGYFEYSTYWGWSNFVATRPERYREPTLGEDMRTNGTLAKGEKK